MTNDIAYKTAWAQVLAAHMGRRITPSEAAFWFDELSNGDHAFIGLSSKEIAEAIRAHAAVSGKREKEAHFDLRDLRKILILFRKHKRGCANTTSEEFVKNVWRAMCEAKNHEDRWNIMCRPDIYAHFPRQTTADECTKLETSATDRWPDFGRPAWAEASRKLFDPAIAALRAPVFEPPEPPSQDDACPF